MDLAQTSLFTWLMDMLRSIAEIRTPFMDGFMSIVTKLGEEWLAVVAAVVFLYCLSKKQGFKFLFLFCFGTFLNLALKQIFMIPRPWVLDPSFQIVEAARAAATGWSFPSGHTQNIVVLCLGISGFFRKKWLTAVMIALALLVGFSRMYLGVHTLLDVGVGMIVSVLVVLLADVLFKQYGDRPAFPTCILGAVSIALLGLLIVILATDGTELRENDIGTAATMFGLSFGLFAGSILERRFVKFEVKAVWWVQLIKIVLGVGVIIGIKSGLKPLFKLIYDNPIMNAPRYFVMAFVAMGVVPLLFKPLGALERKK